MGTDGWLRGCEISRCIWVFPRIVGFPPKSSIFIGFSMKNNPKSPVQIIPIPKPVGG